MFSCLIAAEAEAARVIQQNLSARFPKWRFETATSAEQLFRYAPERPDVLLVSRFLPGAPAEELLRRLVAEFPASRIALMVGVLNEQAKAYMRLAEKYGLNDVITGKLPGDRPRTVFAVLAEAEDEAAVQPAPETSSPKAVAGDRGRDTVQRVQNVQAGFPGCQQAPPAVVGGHTARAPSQPPGQAAGIRLGAGRGLYGSGTPGAVPGHHAGPPPGLRVSRPAHGGKLVLVAANKGGVGKTTVAIALSLALSRSGFKTCLCDFDLGGPNIAVFFGLKNRPGIEVLAGKRDVGRFLPEVLAEVDRNLSVLPGPSDRSLPHLEPWQLVQVVDYLSADHAVVVGDTPPEFWTRRWLEGVFPRADLVLAVVDQSKFSEEETDGYAPKLLLMGVEPSRIKIVCNRYSAKLHSVKKVEAAFNAGLKVKGKDMPRVVAAVPEAWEDFVKGGYRADIPGIDDQHSPWTKLAGTVAEELGLPLDVVPVAKKFSPGTGLFKLFKKGR